MLCYVMLCYVMLCYVMLCYVMLCYVMLCYIKSELSSIIEEFSASMESLRFVAVVVEFSECTLSDATKISREQTWPHQFANILLYKLVQYSAITNKTQDSCKISQYMNLILTLSWLSFSEFFTHLLACPCGSIIKGLNYM